MRRTLFFVLVVALLGGPALADPPPETYPIESYLYWIQSPQRDLEDSAIGQYQVEEGQYGTLRRVLQRYPEAYALGTDMTAEVQAALDGLFHNRPDPPHAHWGDVGHPWYMPDWDHDGVFGDSGGFDPAATGDFDVDTDDVLDTTYFRYPCFLGAADQWRAHYLDASNGCGDTGPFKLGVAHEIKVVNARGLVLDATLWVPGEAFAGSGCPALGSEAYASRAAWTGCVAAANFGSATFPGVVFSNGLSSRQEHYYYFAERLVREGDVVLTYDPAGQGESEGTWDDLFGYSDSARPDCEFAGACRDAQDMVRWFVGDPIPDARGTQNGFRIVARRDPSANVANPGLPVLNASKVSIAGNSMGAISTLIYLRDACAGALLPPVVAAISLSGVTGTCASVPVQFQTSDYDGSPILVGPTLFGVSLGADGDGIGYRLVKERYDDLRENDTTHGGALELIVLEGGVHTDHVAVPDVTRTLWANALAGDYAADWLNCHVMADAAACTSAVTARPHLSRAFASEQDPDGPAGTTGSLCVTIPDRASLNQEPQDFVSAYTGTPVYDCAPS